jgi:urease accessory protein
VIGEGDSPARSAHKNEKNGILELSFARRGDRSVLAHLYRQAPLLAQQALYWDEHLPGLPCVYVITTSGCVLQGDRFDISVAVGDDAMAHVTTQSATKIHRMDEDFAAQSQRLDLAENAYLELLPGPVIPHRHSRFVAQTEAVVAESATLLSAELLQPGRKHHGGGELFEYDLYSSALTVSRPDGTPLCCEKLVAEPWRHPVRQAGVMGTFDIVANVILVAPPRHVEMIFEQVVSGADADAGCMAGISRLPNDAGLAYKVLGSATEPVKAKVRAFWDLVRREATGAPAPAARTWG